VAEKIRAYFASDFHLGLLGPEESRMREKRIVRWLDQIMADATVIYLLGDVFDFWFEYKRAIPKGFTRLLGKLAEITDAGIPVHFFSGNHDMWLRDYFSRELGMKVYHDPVMHQIGTRQFYIAHGDGLGPGDTGYKMLKKLFRNRLARWGFRWLHPDIGIALAHRWSGSSRESEEQIAESFRGPEKERLYHYCLEVLKSHQIDYFVFGHRHIPINAELPNGSRLINLGDWITHNTYGVFDGEQMEIHTFNH